MSKLEDSSSAASLHHVLQFIDDEVAEQRRHKIQMRTRVEQALCRTNNNSLRSCRLELVGSTSWDGDVPQSDVDITLCTPQLGSNKVQMVSILEDLRRSLCCKPGRWKHIKVISAAKVPILQLEDSRGCRCDISVDQVRAIRHRDFLLRELDGRPQVRNLIRLLKYWLRQRGLPLGHQGGIASLAWVFAALSLADQQPCGTSLEVLIMHVFAELHKMGSQFLCVCRDRFGGDLKVVWQEFVSTWVAEWTELFRVEDPTDAQLHITPPSMPTALGLLYVAELRIAWHAIRENNYHQIWSAIVPEAKMELPSIIAGRDASISKTHHLVLKGGLLYFGKMLHVGECPCIPAAEVLHRRDQSSQLHLELLEQRGTMSSLSFQPCHWVCTVVPAEISMQQGDSVSRLIEFAQLLGIPRLSHRLQCIVNVVNRNFFGNRPQLPIYCVWVPVKVIRGPDCQGDEAARRDTQSCCSQIEDKPPCLNHLELQATPTTSATRGFHIQVDKLSCMRESTKDHCESRQAQSLVVDIASDQSTQASDIEDMQLEKDNRNEAPLRSENCSHEDHFESDSPHADSVDESLPSSDLEDLRHEVENIDMHASDALPDGQHDTQIIVSQRLSSGFENLRHELANIDCYEIHAGDTCPGGQHDKQTDPTQQLKVECEHIVNKNHVAIPETDVGTSVRCVTTELSPEKAPKLDSWLDCSIMYELVQTDERDTSPAQKQAVLKSSIGSDETGSDTLDVAPEPAALGVAAEESSMVNVDVNHSRISLRKGGKKRARVKAQAAIDPIVKARVAQAQSVKLACSPSMHGQNHWKGGGRPHMSTVFVIGVLLAVVAGVLLLLFSAGRDLHNQDYDWVAVRPQSAPSCMQTVDIMTRTIDVEIARARAMAQHIRRRAL